MTERIVIIGASGQLGFDLMRAFADLGPIGVDHVTVDIERIDTISGMIARFKPTLVINTAAFHNVEHCEIHTDRAFAVNSVAIDSLAAQCEVSGIPLVHVSTDYIFDGLASEAYAEEAPANPINAYGISKLAGELLIRRRTERHFIVRTSGLYGLRGSSTKGYTFVERMLSQASAGQKLSVVDDMTFSPSFTLHVAEAIRAIVERGTFGTFHVTNTGQCTWYEFALEIFRQAGLAPDVTAVATEAFPSQARRPKFSPLRNAAIARLGLPPLPGWKEGIADYLAERVSSPGVRRSAI
jgi:dTDP-4-dehydrorhamnose reductase